MKHAALVAAASALLACQSPAADPASPATTASTVVEETADTGRDDNLTVGSAFEVADIEGTADGTRQLRSLGAPCDALVLEQGVNHVLQVNAEQPLTLTVDPLGVGNVDLLIAVQAPDETWSCADDANSLDPVFAGMFAEGAHRVFVGTMRNTIVPYALNVRAGVHTPDPIELGGRFPAPVTDGDAPTRTEDGTFGGLQVPANAAAARLPGQAGGTREASGLQARCNGFIAQVPDHVIEVAAPQELTFRVQSEGDTTLLIQGPNDVILCADDEDGLNPVVRTMFQIGRYGVYVGAYQETESPAYTLTVSR